MSQGSRHFTRKREPLQARPQRISLERAKYVHLENLNLVDDFAEWLSQVTGEKVGTESFCTDLSDGRVLCEFVSKLEGSGVSEWHEFDGVEEDVQSMQDFMAMENLITFQEALRRLGVPSICHVSDFRDNNPARIVSSLIYLADIVLDQNLKLKDDHGRTVRMPSDIRERVDTMRSERAGSMRESLRNSLARQSLTPTPEDEAVVEEEPVKTRSWQTWFEGTLDKMMTTLGCKSKKVES